MLLVLADTTGYGDGAGNAVGESSSVFALIQIR